MAGCCGTASRPSYEMDDVEWTGMDRTEFRRELERKFRPIFDKHSADGAPIVELIDELNGDDEIRKKIPQSRVRDLVNKADTNRDRLVSFDEFITLMTSGEVSDAERLAFTSRPVMAVALSNVVPKRQLQSFLDGYRWCPPPLFIPIVSLAEIIIFIVYAVELQNAGQVVNWDQGVPMYSPLVYKPSKRQEAWRFLTYMLIHQGILHILFNMVFQLLFGIPLEMFHGWWRVMIVYLLGVISGSLAHSLVDHGVALVGASGGVYALLGAHLAAVITNWDEMNTDCCSGNPVKLLLSAPVRMTVILCLVVPDTSIAIYRRVTAPSQVKVGILAHIGGFLAGVGLGVPVLKNMEVKMWESVVGKVFIVVFLVFLCVCFFFNGLYPGYPKTEW